MFSERLNGIIFVASPSMGLGVALSFYYLRNIINPSTNLFVNFVKILTILLFSHFIAGFLCGIFLTLLNSYEYSIQQVVIGIVGTMVYSLIVSPITLIIITVGAFILNRQHRGSEVSNV